jgi:methylase of polypeptide subunit release factors
MLKNIYKQTTKNKNKSTIVCLWTLKEKSTIIDIMPGICLEIGCGSGVITSSLSSIIQSGGKSSLHFAVDLNPVALSVTKRTAEANSVKLLEVIPGFVI